MGILPEINVFVNYLFIKQRRNKLETEIFLAYGFPVSVLLQDKSTI